MANRRHVPIAPAINVQNQDPRNGYHSPSHSAYHSTATRTSSSSSSSTWSSAGNQLNNNSAVAAAAATTTVAPMSIPSSRNAGPPPPPRALPPPTHISHANDPTSNDLGWMWGNLNADMRPEPTSRPVSPASISAVDRRDSQSLFDEDPRRRKSSTSTIASMRSPSYMGVHDSVQHRDSVPSPSGHSEEAMLTSHRLNPSHAYDDMLKRRIGGGPPNRPSKPSSYDVPSRGLTFRDAPSHKQLTFRSLSLQETTAAPSSPRKLSSSNNPHWDPDSSSILTSPSISSSRQSYFSSDSRDSPADTYSTASSVSSYGSSMHHSKAFNDGGFHRIQAPSRIPRESGLSMAMTAATTTTSSTNISSSSSSPTRTPSSAQYASFPKSRYSPGYQSTGSGVPGGYPPNNSLGVPVQKSDSSSRSLLRPPQIQEEVVILPTHHSDYPPPHHHPQYSSRHTMKRKGAPDSSERDGPPSQQLQQEGRRSPNPVAIPYASPQQNNSYPSMQQHMSSSSDRLSPSVNPLSEPSHDRNSPYLNQLAIDPVLNSSAHPYPIDAQELAARAAQSVSVESLGHHRESNTPLMTSSPLVPGNTPHICECCPKKPKRFNTEGELRRHMNEKQYVCSYCHNRFKNKNEMERHQMSLHLRDRSWSCAALERNYEAAFHPSTAIPPNNPGHAQQIMPPPPAPSDVCGYCGQTFPNPPDYLARGEHLTVVHKFAECNQSKKFWRADHFRQHLKHSHGGIPGKWTNMLEHACLKEEISPLPVIQPGGDDGNHLAQAQAAHAARVAQAAAEQASQAVQQQQQREQQQQQQQQHQHHQHHPGAQQQLHHSSHDNHHGSPLTAYQASQLQNATVSNASNNMGDSRRGPYPSMQQSPHEFGPLVGEGGTD